MINRVIVIGLKLMMMTVLVLVIPVKAMALNEIDSTISAGSSYSIAIKEDGSLWSWGDNEYGQLGDGTTEDKTVPIKIIDNVSSASAGNVHTMAIKADGSLWTWGYNISSMGKETYQPNIPTPIKVMDNIESVSSGGYFSMALKQDNSLWVWGRNDYYQLGDNTTEYKEFPVKIMDSIISISASMWHGMAIKSDNSVWAWGKPALVNSIDNRVNFSETPVKFMDDVISVSTGDHHAMMIKSDSSLWAWGWNGAGQLGDGTYDDKSIPIKIMDNVAFVSAGSNYTMAIKTDGSLWSWGDNNRGQLGYAIANKNHTPRKIMDNVALVSAGDWHAMAVKIDGSLWAWGRNEHGQLGDGTTVNKYIPQKIMEGIMLPTGISTFAPTFSNRESAYIYDTTDPNFFMLLPTDQLKSVTDKITAVSAIQSAASGMISEQKQSATGIDLITLYSEEAVAQAASKTMPGTDIVIDQSNVQYLQVAADDVKTAAEQTLATAGITTARELNANIKFKTNESNSIKITVDPSAINTTADNIRVETPDYALSLSAKSIKENAGSDPLIITITENSSTASAPVIHDSMALVSTERVIPMPNMDIAAGTSPASSTKTYNISFNKPVTENIKVSFPPASGDPTYQAITNSAGTAVGGKYNPVTGNLEAKINKGDTYTVRENRKDFTDITNKSKEMQEAIRILASKGIISGTTATQFSPDGTITRAEIAALIVRTLSKLDPNADGGFSDVKKSDWFFGSVGSAKRYGIINGMTETTFAPLTNIQKDQIVAITARTLRTEMKYKNPTDIEKFLGTYSDRGDIPSWGTTDIALATRENLVVKRTDNKFVPSGTMTRGDAAIILYRMFNKIW